MRVRRVDADGDMVFGGDQAAFHHDTPDAVAQVVESRLQLWQGQWFLDLAEGTEVETRVLGKRTEATRDPVYRSRILGSPGVVAITAYNSVLNRDTRSFGISATIDTAFGRGVQGRSSATAQVDTFVQDGR